MAGGIAAQSWMRGRTVNASAEDADYPFSRVVNGQPSMGGRTPDTDRHVLYGDFGYRRPLDVLGLVGANFSSSAVVRWLASEQVDCAPLVFTNFRDTDSTGLESHANLIGGSWETFAGGEWTIAGNVAEPGSNGTDPGSALTQSMVIDAGSAEVEINARLTLGASGTIFAGIVFRAVDNNNHWDAFVGPTTGYRIKPTIGGSQENWIGDSSAETMALFPAGATRDLRLRTAGASIRFQVFDTSGAVLLDVSGSDSRLATATRAGFGGKGDSTCSWCHIYGYGGAADLTIDQAFDAAPFVSGGWTLPNIAHVIDRTAARYWTLELIDEGNADGYLELGEAVQGPLWAPEGFENFDFQSGAGWRDRSRLTLPESGGILSEMKTPARRLDLSWSGLSEADAWRYGDLERATGARAPMLVVPYPGATAMIEREHTMLARRDRLDPPAKPTRKLLTARAVFSEAI